MKAVLRLAWRSIWRNRRRTVISMVAVGVGTTLVIFYASMLAGVLGDAKEQLDNTGMGHVEITAAGWRAHRRVEENLADPGALLARLDLPGGSQVGWRVVARGLLSSARTSEGVELIGVDWEREASLSAQVRDVVRGERPALGDDGGILIGEKLAERLQVKVGSKLKVMVQREGGELGADLYRVRGVYHALSPAISARRVFVSAASARRLLGVGGVAHQIVIQLDRAADADAVAARLRRQLGAGGEVLSYGELLPALRTFERLSDRVVWLAALFIYGLVGLGILNTLLMSVMERTREFGVLRALGTRPGRVVAQVLGEAFWIATLSGLLGLAVGLLVTWYGSQHSLINVGGGGALEYAGTVLRSNVRCRFSPGEALQAAGFVYVMALGVGIYPAWKVARLAPARALHTS